LKQDLAAQRVTLRRLYVEFTFSLPGFVKLISRQPDMMKTEDRKKRYQSYLLRLWVEDVDGKQVWRVSLEDPFTGERRGFASRRDLCAYLEEKMSESKENQEVSNES
jgi:hypothetical protein